MIIAVINGPNINLLGKREPEHYGTKTWDEIERKLVELSEELECELLFFQSNYEGAIVDFIQENMDVLDGIVINPAGYSKTGYAILLKFICQIFLNAEVHIVKLYFKQKQQAILSDCVKMFIC